MTQRSRYLTGTSQVVNADSHDDAKGFDGVFREPVFLHLHLLRHLHIIRVDLNNLEIF